MRRGFWTRKNVRLCAVFTRGPQWSPLQGKIFFFVSDIKGKNWKNDEQYQYLRDVATILGVSSFILLSEVTLDFAYLWDSIQYICHLKI